MKQGAMQHTGVRNGISRLGILGGTFNPIHHGHLVAASEVAQRFGLERLVLLPTNYPPHKHVPDLPESHHRLAMVEQAVADHPLFTVCDLELMRPGLSYTVDTLPALAERYGADAALYFIVGTDVFREFAAWKDADALLKLCHFVVITRPPHTPLKLKEHLASTLSPVYHDVRFEERDGLEGEEAVGLVGSPFSVFTCRVPHLEISSTEIRQGVQQGRSIRYLLPDVVARYIYQEKLYDASGGASGLPPGWL